MTKFLKTTLLAGAATLLGATGAQAAPMAYTLGDDGSTLVTFSPDATGFSGMALTGAAASLDALAYRPSTGQLYGYDDDTDSVYLVDPMTGATTFVVRSSVNTESDTLGFDFNNQVDAARIVTIADQNIVFFPDGEGAPRTEAFTMLEYADGDVNAGTGPEIIANAYTNQVANAASTTQYGLDSELNTLVTIANNAGTLNTVDTLTFADGTELDFDPNAGFDIFTDENGQNIGYALLTTVDGIGFYEIDLGAAIVTFLGDVSSEFGVLSGLAVFDNMAAPIPVPAAGFLFVGGAAGLAAMRRKKRAS